MQRANVKKLKIDGAFERKLSLLFSSSGTPRVAESVVSTAAAAEPPPAPPLPLHAQRATAAAPAVRATAAAPAVAAAPGVAVLVDRELLEEIIESKVRKEVERHVRVLTERADVVRVKRGKKRMLLQAGQIRPTDEIMREIHVNLQ